MIYEAIAKRQPYKPDVVLFYDEDRKQTIKFLHQYRRQHGYSVKDSMGTFTVRDLILRERTTTGEIISEVPYRELEGK